MTATTNNPPTMTVDTAGTRIEDEHENNTGKIVAFNGEAGSILFNGVLWNNVSNPAGAGTNMMAISDSVYSRSRSPKRMRPCAFSGSALTRSLRRSASISN